MLHIEDRRNALNPAHFFLLILPSWRHLYYIIYIYESPLDNVVSKTRFIFYAITKVSGVLTVSHTQWEGVIVFLAITNYDLYNYDVFLFKISGN